MTATISRTETLRTPVPETPITRALHAVGVEAEPAQAKEVANAVIQDWENNPDRAIDFLAELGDQPLPPLTSEQLATRQRYEQMLALGDLPVYAMAHRQL